MSVQKDWAVLSNPTALQQQFSAGGPSPHPANIELQADPAETILQLPMALPALFIEPFFKLEVMLEQREARKAMSQAKVPFDVALARATELYGDGNLLKLKIGMHGSRPVYFVWALVDGKPKQARIDGITGESTSFRASLGSVSDALKARPLATLTFEQALAQAFAEIAGQVYEFELEMDDGQPTFELAIMAMSNFVEVEVHAVTGEVLEVETETAIR